MCVRHGGLRRQVWPRVCVCVVCVGTVPICLNILFSVPPFCLRWLRARGLVVVAVLTRVSFFSTRRPRGFFRLPRSIFSPVPVLPPMFAKFDWIYGILPDSDPVLPSFTEFYRVLLSFTEFCRVLPSFTEFYRVLPSFT